MANLNAAANKAGKSTGAKRAVMERWGLILSSLYHDRPPPGWRKKPADWKPTAAKFAEAFELKSDRTVLRDLQAMRDAGYDLRYESTENRWYWYNKDTQGILPSIAMTEEKLLAMLSAIFLSNSMLDDYNTRALRVFLRKLENFLPGGFVHSLADVEASLSYKRRFRPPGEQVWTRLQRAILDEKVVTFFYDSPWMEGPPRKRKVLPLHLALIDEAWFLYALPVGKPGTGVRQYRLSRLKDLRVLAQRRPGHKADLKKLRERIRQGVGPFHAHGPGRETVVLRMDERVLRFMREYAWDPEPEITDLRAGKYLLSFESTQVDASDPLAFHPLLPFVLSWIPYVEVLEPDSLRERVAAIATESARMHDRRKG